jgi:hypothetical protein
MTNGLAQNDSHLALPISPTRIFLAVQRHSMLEHLKTLGDQVVSIANTRIAGQAIKYVYGTDASQLYFIAQNLGKKIRSTPLDEIFPTHSAAQSPSE